MLQLAGYVQGLAAELRADGVWVLECPPETGFAGAGREWRVKIPLAQITTPQIILANNGHLESFGIANGKLMQLFP